jgi:WD40 repeat protein
MGMPTRATTTARRDSGSAGRSEGDSDLQGNAMIRKKLSVRAVSVKIYWRRMLRAFAMFPMIICATAGGQAQNATPELPTDPILRIETGQHGAKITRIATDTANRVAVTASLDKTLRVWSLSDGRLMQVLRLPVDQGNIGKAYAVAVSPDGTTIAVGGWTAPVGQPENIYLFDRASGKLKQRLTDLPEVVLDLAYSLDGRRLAASLGAKGGIQVFDAGNDYRKLPSDTQYGDQSYSAAFDRSGRLVTTSLDGFVRLYAADRYDTPIVRFETPGHRPISAVFSPDGSRIGISYDDTKDVVVLAATSLKELKELFKANTIGVTGINLGAVGWSEDGEFLFAGGRWSVHNAWQVRRWSDGGRGAFVDIPVGSNTIQKIIGLKEGRTMFASTRNFGVIQADTTPLWIQGFGALQLTSGRGPFRISRDGDTVQVDSWEPLHTYRFAFGRRQIDLDPPTDASLLAPVTEAPRLSIMNWKNSTAPAVNGTALTLQPYETSRSLAIAPSGELFVLGADWRLRLFDRNGHEVWPSQPAPDATWQVNVTADGLLIVAAFGDGTVRWSRVSDGQELLALFIHPDGQRWIAWTPQGYYDASLGADDLIGWHINHGYGRVPDFYPASQFRDRYYRPDVIQRVLKTPNLDIAEAVREADQAAGQPATRSVPVSSLLTPVVEIDDPKDPASEDRTDMQLAYSVKLPSAEDKLRVEALIDGVKVAAEERRLVEKGDTRAGILYLKIPRRDSKVSVIAYNANGASVPASVQVKWTGAGTEPKLTLYVLAIGISDYKDPNLRLHFAAKDAADFVALAKAQAGGLYDKVILAPGHESLRDGQATKDAILDGLDWIMRDVTNTNDVAMVFLSGHGIRTPDQHYRFLPYDYDVNRIERTTISDSELQDYLTKIGGKKIFFFDTCYSGGVMGARATDTQPDVDKFANELKAAENGIIVFSSTTGNQLSQERDEWNNGAFTKAVVEGMRGAAARLGLVLISVSDLQGYVSQRVKELTLGNQRPVTAIPKTVDDFWIAQRLN